MAQKFTPNEINIGRRNQMIKFKRIDHSHPANNPKKLEGVEYAVSMCPPGPVWPLTYYNNGKCNSCCKTPYDYAYCFCNGYDQKIRRDDRKHPHFYMNIDLEEQYPSRTVPLLTNSNYGHLFPVDAIDEFYKGKKNEIGKFYRPSGLYYCVNANGYNSVRHKPTWAFRPTACFGYTCSHPRQ